MSLQQIRNYYQVPAFRGRRILFEGRPGVIVGSCRPGGLYLRARLDEDGQIYTLHPTWEIEYVNAKEAVG